MSVVKSRLEELELIRKSARHLDYHLTNVPDGVTLVSARWMLKASQSDADGSALVSKQVTLSAGPNGHVMDDGASGTAKVRITIDNDDLDAVVPNVAMAALKCVLSDGLSVEVPNSRVPVRLLPAAIQATS